MTVESGRACIDSTYESVWRRLEPPLSITFVGDLCRAARLPAACRAGCFACCRSLSGRMVSSTKEGTSGSSQPPSRQVGG